MNLHMDESLAAQYKNGAQKTRVVTESWVSANMFCPRCGNPRISSFENNRPVADFFCPNCRSQYELKSKNGLTLNRVNDGAYSAMIRRIASLDNPDFFFLSYSKNDWRVQNLFFVPKHFLTPDMIEKRRPLAPTARRAGWVGCNILFHAIPTAGRIPIIEKGIVQDEKRVIDRVAASERLMVKDIQQRGWLFDILSCVDKLGDSFTLSEMYSFESELARKYPDNHNIRPKIRQQLQMLRDRGFIAFSGRGEYRKVLK